MYFSHLLQKQTMKKIITKEDLNIRLLSQFLFDHVRIGYLWIDFYFFTGYLIKKKKV